MRQLLSILLVVILCATSTYAAKPPGSSASIPAQVAQKPTLQEQVLEIPPGSLVVVRLKNKEKLRGRLGELSNEGFILKYTKGNEIKERKVSFDELKSIKSKRGGSKVGKAVVYILAGVGVTFLVVIAFLASRDSL